MQKIILVLYFKGHGWNPRYWSHMLNMVLSDLVDQLCASGYRHTLEFEFQLEPGLAEAHQKVGLDEFFPHFREKGRVTLSEPINGRIFYCSD